MTTELHEILDAIGGMCIQHGATGLDQTELASNWPRWRWLLLDALFKQVAIALDYNVDGRIEDPITSADEAAVAVLVAAGWIERHERPRWWHIGKRDPRPSGYYLTDVHRQQLRTPPQQAEPVTQIPKRPTHQADPDWPEKWGANEHAVATQATQALRELLDSSENFTIDEDQNDEKVLDRFYKAQRAARDVIEAIESSGWKP